MKKRLAKFLASKRCEKILKAAMFIYLDEKAASANSRITKKQVQALKLVL